MRKVVLSCQPPPLSLLAASHAGVGGSTSAPVADLSNVRWPTSDTPAQCSAVLWSGAQWHIAHSLRTFEIAHTRPATHQSPRFFCLSAVLPQFSPTRALSFTMQRCANIARTAGARIAARNTNAVKVRRSAATRRCHRSAACAIVKTLSHSLHAGLPTCAVFRSRCVLVRYV